MRAWQVTGPLASTVEHEQQPVSCKIGSDGDASTAARSTALNVAGFRLESVCGELMGYSTTEVGVSFTPRVLGGCH